MGSQEGKNKINITKSNTASSKNSGSTTARLKQHNTDEAEENDLKNNFREMFEALKEEMKSSLKKLRKRK